MKKLTKVEQIWKTHATDNDVKIGIDYATISLPWTFDRMRYGQSTQNSMNKRLANILIGVLNQTILKRKLTSKGFSCKMDWTGYRESDIFDFQIGDKIYDVKTSVIYSEYDKQNKRKRFSPEMEIKNRNNQGPKFLDFFPKMVAMSQLSSKKKKDSYIFGVADTEKDIRKNSNPEKNDKGYWCSSPFGDASAFFHNRILIEKRESEKKGFYPIIQWDRNQNTLDSTDKKITVTFIGEWNKKKKIQKVTLLPGEVKQLEEEMSSLSTIHVNHPSSLIDLDVLLVKVKNNYKKFVPKYNDPNLNLNNDKFEWLINKKSFINLKITKYSLYWIGHIPYDEFMKTFQNYPCYFAPSGAPGSDENTTGRITDRMRKKLESLDRSRANAISEGKNPPQPEFIPLMKNSKIDVGMLLSAQMGFKAIGAACYYYPSAYSFPESAFYVLPKDLHIMDSLKP